MNLPAFPPLKPVPPPIPEELKLPLLAILAVLFALFWCHAWVKRNGFPLWAWRLMALICARKS